MASRSHLTSWPKGPLDIERWSPLLGWLVCAVLAVAVVVVFVDMFDQVDSPANGSASIIDQAATPTNSLFSGSLADLHLFGETPRAAYEAVVRREQAAPTELELVLKGTVANQSTGGYALIEDSFGNQDRYSVDDEVAGARVAEIHTDRVILERRGQFESLLLEDATANRLAPRSSASTTSRPAISRPGIRASGSTAAGTAPPNIAASSEVDWNALREEIKADPARIMQNVSALPVNQDGVLQGYRLNAGGDPSLLRKLGLQSSDVVTAINGRSLADPTQTMAALQQLADAPSVNVTIKRAGRTMNLNVDLSDGSP